MHGLSQMLGAVKAASTIHIAECKRDQDMFAPNVGIHMTFGLSSTADAAVAENMRFYNKIGR